MKCKTLFFIISIALLSSCDNSEVDLNEINGLEISLSKTKIIDDNFDYAKVIVKDQNGNVVTGITDILISGVEAASSEIKSGTPGVLEISAIYNEVISNSVSLEVVEDPGLNYYKSVLIEQYTGTWCGYCPRAISAIDNVLDADSDVTHIAYHLSDEMAYLHNNTLFKHFGFSGVPSMMADRRSEWTGSASVINSLHKPVRAGISISVNGNSSNVNIDVTCTFGVIYPETLKLSVYILEDSLVYDQANYYNDDSSSPWYQKGNPVVGVTHNNVMFKILTDLYGNVIPSASIDINSSYTTKFTLNSPLVSDINNLKAVVFISYGSGNKKEEVINSLACFFGENAQSTLEN